MLRKRLYHSLPADVQRLFLKKRFFEKSNARIEERLQSLNIDGNKVTRINHHLCHAASAYFGLRKNPVDPHIVLTLDGGGDEECSHVYIAEKGQLKLIAKTPNGHSIGNIYARMTHFMGMTPHEHEYKLMGLAAYSKRNRFIAPLIDILRGYIDLDPQNPLAFKCHLPESTALITPRLMKDFRRVRFDNLAAAIQFFTEELLVRWVRAVIEKTGIRNIVASGGVFMNVKANKCIAEMEEADYFDVFPSCGDESLPFGAVWKQYSENSPTKGDDITFDNYYLGPDSSFDLDESVNKHKDKLEFREVEEPEKLIADLLAQGKIVARCSGRMEFGARALGNRSILADPGDQRVIPEINKMIKQRDFWMPFAPAILYEGADEYIRIPPSLPKNRISPYMMHTFDTTERRDEFIAGTHSYDKTARAQILLESMNPGLYSLIREFSKLRHKTVVLNTSFNLHGFPIVMGSGDAMDVMLNSSLEYLIINNTFITKKT